MYFDLLRFSDQFRPVVINKVIKTYDAKNIENSKCQDLEDTIDKYAGRQIRPTLIVIYTSENLNFMV